MADQSAFDRNQIETSATSETSGILEQLNLPPAIVSFLQKNQRMLWAIVIVAAVSVTAVSLYGSYRNYQIKQANSAFDAAMLESGEKRGELLLQVVEKYSSTPSGPWARVELAKIAADKDDFTSAIVELQAVNAMISAENPLKPLVLYSLGGMQEKMQDYAAAAGFYIELTAFPGFAADAHYALGRVYVSLDKKAEAVEQYTKYLSLTGEISEGMMPQQDPRRDLVKHTIKSLQ